jgi:hypothetical protein
MSHKIIERFGRLVIARPKPPADSILPHQRPEHEFDNPKSEYYIPNDGLNRESANPHTATTDGPAYTVNAESLCLADPLGKRPPLDPFWGLIGLVDKINDPSFHLEPICRACETWKPAQVTRPTRKAAQDTTTGCLGCHFSHLDGKSGGEGAFVNHDKNAAFSAWAKAKADVRELELKKSVATGQAKARLESRLSKAWKRVESCAKRCQRLGFKPTMPRMGQDQWERPLMSPTHDQMRKDREQQSLQKIREPRTKTSPSCRNCRNWTENKGLSGGKGTYGDCWVFDYATRANHWCADHNLKD